jgi:transcriptional regulator of nitric oxide reductase/ferredoxin
MTLRPLRAPLEKAAAGDWRKRFAAAVLMLLLLMSVMRSSAAAGVPAEIAELFPAATRIEAASGTPPAVEVFRDATLLGYAFRSRDTVASTGFSGRPLDVLVGLGVDGMLAGAKVLEHHEPILAIGVDAAKLAAFTSQYRGIDIARPARVAITRRHGAELDAISGASISSVVIDDAIIRSARAVARSRGILRDGLPATTGIDLEAFEPRSWTELEADGSLARLRVGVAEARRSLPDAAPGAAAEAPFVDIYITPLAPARIGRNLLGDRDYARLVAETAPGETAILIAGAGVYSFKGTSFVRTGLFERIQLVQGPRTIRLTADRHRRVERLVIAAAPELRELGVFTLPAEAGFDLAQPWRFELLAAQKRADGSDAIASFSLTYRLPELYRRSPEAAEAPSEPLWQEVWRQRAGHIVVLGIALGVLTTMLFFQDWIVGRPRLYAFLRPAFLAFTLLWLGWYAGAQLSVMNVLTFVHALLTGFRWDFFLLDPLLFMLWSFVALAMLFWGRGVFCGWLCPFGALQELANRAARWLRVPQLRLPFLLHERLWPLKYVAFVALLAVTLQSLEAAQPWTEIEPFKTAIILHFARSWPFVAYALALLVAGLFIERFFCRYLCPLGAALALPARQRLFEWLKRKWQCGRECQICAVHCPVQAIHPTGQINPHECIHCLNCQKLYYDDRVCPPLIERRKRHEARRALRKTTPQAQPEAVE